MSIPVDNDWTPILKEAEQTASYQELREFLKKEYVKGAVYPVMDDIWQAFEWTPFSKVKVVILGQDPYHGKHQAHGLSFSVRPEVGVPPSLKNIYKELERDLGIYPVSHGYLKKWAEEGVLLLNTVLTVRGGEAHSHRNRGWEELTDHVIKSLSEREKPIVFLLWGNAAQKKEKMIDTRRHVVLKTSHPSPLSAYRGFLGSGVFSETNRILKEMGDEPVDWSLPENPND
ncbi:uracil-DNA glycosylase [Alkalibacterium pelagium]|uniref:Uracil-DNA glycosylase n=1 Tax=Alkalibacterium pelagium TaxID=426702 RepID=A0A1H7LJT7_9LACT|nr:uracil-DNA glycosylase [Alkalibacterium pelagium]GEN50860.1 uracil-DNA glycosylase [Alkalibacterium pelagium]SEK99156.1 Uracil-DNA glycosylase [Alkalibacterium pelagium]